MIPKPRVFPLLQYFPNVLRGALINSIKTPSFLFDLTLPKPFKLWNRFFRLPILASVNVMLHETHLGKLHLFQSPHVYTEYLS